MPARRPRPAPLARRLLLALGLSAGAALAADGRPAPAPVAQPTPPTAPATPKTAATPAPGDPQAVVERIRAALAKQTDQNKMHVLVGDEPIASRPPGAATPRPARPKNSKTPAAARAPAAAEAAKAHAGEPHWAYAGAHGPEHWGSLKPDYHTCASGQRQSPIAIQSGDTAPGPAEPIGFHYRASGGSVVHNGHTIQVDLGGDQHIRVRGSTYRLVQFHFHHPAEEQINGKTFAMVAHLVHRNEAGQLAVVAVLMDPGTTNPFIDQLWTHMPLEAQDRVPLPDGSIDLNALLPADQRYYQYMGSLTTPPCTEGVLWLVLRQPVTVSERQRQLFARLFPMNARPVQAVNGRLVREGI